MNDNTAKMIIENYELSNEDIRLKDSFGILEEAHTRLLITEQLSSSVQEIYDIGGGTGAYSFWLAQQGYKVHLSDIVPKHIQIAKEKDTEKILKTIQVEDARWLSYKDEVADLIILHGPLYHLINIGDRELVLKECKRILRPNGRLLAFTMGRYAGLNYGLASNTIFNDSYYEMVINEIKTGVRDNHEQKLKTFIEAYFHTQEEIENELCNVGFSVGRTYGVIGPSWNVPNLDEAVNDKKKFERLLYIADLMKEYPIYGPRMLTIGNKTDISK